jgi:hypothetical protein
MTGYEAAFRDLREHFYGKAVLGVVNATSPASWFFYQMLDLPNTTIPALGYFDFRENIPKRIPFKYPDGRNITKKSMMEFYEDAVSGKL